MKNKSAAQTPGPSPLRMVEIILPWITLGILLHSGAVPVVSAEVRVAGGASSQLDPELTGLVLIEELNCAACHARGVCVFGASLCGVRARSACRLCGVRAIGVPHAWRARVCADVSARPAFAPRAGRKGWRSRRLPGRGVAAREPRAASS
jgi:hypothetical protein